MSKLLNAEFSRLFRSIIFRLGMFIYAAAAVFAVTVNYLDVKKYAEVSGKSPDEIYFSADGFVFGGAFYLIVSAAILIGIFVGTEYSDGTMRNKFISGHSRAAVYLSKLTVCAAANIIMNIIFTVFVIILGGILLDKTELPIKYYAVFILCAALFSVTLTAMYLLFAMLIPNKAAGAITAILFSFALVITTMVLNDRLDAPEIFEEYYYVDKETGETVYIPEERNAHYPTGIRRKVYETLYDTIPACQLYRVNIQDYDAMGKMSLYTAGELIIFTMAGLLIFNKKDLR